MKMKDALRRFKAEIFQALAHPTRIAIVEALRDGELPAGKLIEKLELEQANASQHFAILRTKQIVVNRKAGNQVFYSLRDPVLIAFSTAPSGARATTPMVAGPALAGICRISAPITMP